MQIKQIHLAEDIPDSNLESEKEALEYDLLNTDVIVRLDNGHSYRANFITLKKLAIEFKALQKNVGGIGKNYFWSKSMVIVENMGKDDLAHIIEYMVEEGDFQMIFEKL